MQIDGYPTLSSRHGHCTKRMTDSTMRLLFRSGQPASLTIPAIDGSDVRKHWPGGHSRVSSGYTFRCKPSVTGCHTDQQMRLAGYGVPGDGYPWHNG